MIDGAVYLLFSEYLEAITLYLSLGIGSVLLYFSFSNRMDRLEVTKRDEDSDDGPTKKRQRMCELM